MVPVVVRDRQGRAIGGLSQEDFQLFDKGKPQVISKFSREKAGQSARLEASPVKPDETSDQVLPAGTPDRFVAYLFDDIHLNFGDMARVRDAAGRHMDSLPRTDRAAIFTTSGQVMLEFTDDRDQLHQTLARLVPRPIARVSSTSDCPDVSYYQADLIQNRRDPIALQAATLEAAACNPNTPASVLASIVQSAAMRVLPAGEQETRVALAVLRDAVRRMSAMPGQRTIILASPGFITPEFQQEKTDVMDRAIRANVIISSVDARGLYTDPSLDASRPGGVDTTASRLKAQMDRDSALAQADVLAELAAGTGGTFFQNNNDLDAGFQRVASLPEYYYILGFSPQNLKLDGAFHTLKVTLKDPAGLSAQARRGYYAPKHISDAVENARREIEEALFSREEMHELPVDLHTQFFKANAEKANITILTHVDLKHLKLRKAEGRSRNDLTIVAGLFDRNGNYVTGNQKLVEMRLKDETIEKRAESGITVRTSFDVKPGIYLVRLVVRDAEGQLMSAANGAVEIPQ